MEKFDIKKYSKHILLILFLVTLVLAVIVVKPFLTAILGGVILTYIFYPVYRKLNRIIKNKTVCSLLVSFLVAVIMIVPLFFVTNSLINESVGFYHNIRTIDVSDVSAKISKVLGQNIDLSLYVKEILGNLSIKVMEKANNIIFSLPQAILIFFVTLFIMYYLFKEGKDIIQRIKNAIPFREDHRENLARRFNNLIYATVYGVIITSVIQGMVGALGLWIFKVPSPVLLGITIFIAAMLPVIAAWLVWLPASIIKIVGGDIFNGVGLLIYGLVVISMIDFLRPKIIGNRAQLHPVLVLLGVLGGLYMFGLVGVIFGPLVLTSLVAFLETYLSEKNEAKS